MSLLARVDGRVTEGVAVWRWLVAGVLGAAVPAHGAVTLAREYGCRVSAATGFRMALPARTWGVAVFPAGAGYRLSEVRSGEVRARTGSDGAVKPGFRVWAFETLPEGRTIMFCSRRDPAPALAVDDEQFDCPAAEGSNDFSGITDMTGSQGYRLRVSAATGRFELYGDGGYVYDAHAGQGDTDTPFIAIGVCVGE